MRYYIGADLGTSALKLLLLNEAGDTIRTVTRTYAVHYPRPGWSEQSPADWWEAFVSGVREITAGSEASSIRGIGVAGQMHGLVALDAADEVIRPAILWNDGRSAAETDYLNEQIGRERLSSLTANIAFAGFTAPKLLWMRAHEKQNFDRIEKIMLPKDYVNYRLTGVHATDFSDASGFLLLDVQNKCWSRPMLEICGITERQMPTLYESGACIGTILPHIADALGLPRDVKVAAGAGDNAAAALGMATVGAGKCNISLGTSGTVFISADTFAVDPHNALHAFCHADGRYHLMGCILTAASASKWFCEEVLKTSDYAGEQAQIPRQMLGQNDVFFLPYLMGERSPINDTNATGLFIGLRPNTTRAQMLLAVLEGVSFAIRDNLEIAKRLGLTIQTSTVCGGGAKSALWMQILANVLHLPLALPETEEGPGHGAALLAMTAAGDAASVRDCLRCTIRQTVYPDEKLSAAYEERYQKFRKLYPAVRALYKELKEDR